MEKINWNQIGPHEKRVFKINVENIKPEDVEAYVKEIANRFKKPIEGIENFILPIKDTNYDITYY